MIATSSPRRALLGVVVLAAALCTAGALVRPAPPAAAESTVQPVVRGAAVCPRPTTAGTTTSALGLVAADVPDAEGLAVLADLRTGEDELLRIDAPGTRAALTVPKQSAVSPMVMRVEGSLAPYVSAGLVTSTTGGRARGLSAVACAAPASDSWFVGGGGAVGRQTTVWLSNPDTTQAVVDIQVYGPEGPVVGHGATGIVVAAQRQVGVRLDVIVPGTTRAALHVVARAGRLSAAVSDVDTKGLIPRGADYVPASSSPATRVVIPGVLGGDSGRRLLQVAAPGDADAIVNVRVVAQDGTFTPGDTNLVEVSAGSIAQVDLAGALKDTGTSSVVLESDVPVVAGVRTVLPRPGGAAEVSYTAGTAALGGPASFAPVLRTTDDVPALVLTAADAAAVVTVTVLDPGTTAPVSQRVTVPAGMTVSTLLADLRSGAGVVVAPEEGSGPVQAALLMARSDGIGSIRTTVPLVSGPSTLTVPAVRPDPAAGIPGH